MGLTSKMLLVLAFIGSVSSLYAQQAAQAVQGAQAAQQIGQQDYYDRRRTSRLGSLASTASPTEEDPEAQCVQCCHGPGGTMGMPGPNGPSGSAGAPGIPGVPGNHGINGHDGNPGFQGAKGDSGPQGLPGLKGASGTNGRPGIPGLTGRVGPRGPPGSGNGEPTVTRSAFSAARTTTLTAPPASDIIITFEHVFTNFGNHFDAYSGIYMAPVPGAYYFIFNIHMASTHKNPYVKLMLNGKMQVAVHDYDNRDAFDSTTNSVILELQTSDRVWLQLDADNEVSSNSNRYTTFSGYMIFKL